MHAQWGQMGTATPEDTGSRQRAQGMVGRGHGTLEMANGVLEEAGPRGSGGSDGEQARQSRLGRQRRVKEGSCPTPVFRAGAATPSAPGPVPSIQPGTQHLPVPARSGCCHLGDDGQKGKEEGCSALGVCCQPTSGSTAPPAARSPSPGLPLSASPGPQ